MNLSDQIKELAGESGYAVLVENGQARIWKKLWLVSRLDINRWYDYIDTKALIFGQCQLSAHGDSDQGMALNPTWFQFPMNWRHYPDQQDCAGTPDDYSEECNQADIHNERYLFLEYIGTFKMEISID